jgi:hypothetical protein
MKKLIVSDGWFGCAQRSGLGEARDICVPYARLLKLIDVLLFKL